MAQREQVNQSPVAKKLPMLQLQPSSNYTHTAARNFADLFFRVSPGSALFNWSGKNVRGLWAFLGFLWYDCMRFEWVSLHPCESVIFWKYLGIEDITVLAGVIEVPVKCDGGQGNGDHSGGIKKCYVGDKQCVHVIVESYLENLLKVVCKYSLLSSSCNENNLLGQLMERFWRC